MSFFSLCMFNRPQELALYGEFTLRETLLYFGWINGLTTSEADEKIEFLIRLLQLPSVTRFVKSLSGGQQRRMSLAAALLHGNERITKMFSFEFSPFTLNFIIGMSKLCVWHSFAVVQYTAVL